MNARKLVLIFFILVLAAALAAGCGSINPTPAPTAMPPVRLTQPPTFAPSPAPSATATATLVQASPTPADPALKAVADTFAALEEGNYEEAAAMYSNFSLMVDEITRGEAAAALKSQFARGEAISNGQVLESRAFDERTHLVHVRYMRGSKNSATGKTSAKPGAAAGAAATATPASATQEPTVTLASGSFDQTRQAQMISDATANAAQAIATQEPTVTLASGSFDQTRQAQMISDATATALANATPTATATATAPATTGTPSAEGTPTEKAPVEVDEWWAVRMESGQWRVNRGNLIDFQTLDVPVQTTAGLTVKPRQLTRYTDRMRLTLLVQNQTNEAIVLGQANEVMATFLFGDQKIEAKNKVMIFERLRSNPDTIIELEGLYDTYPDGIIIRQWKNVQVAPWFEFRFN